MKRGKLVENKNTAPVLGALFMVAAFVFGLIVTDKATADNTPLITVVTGLFGLYITQTLGKAATINKLEQVDSKVDRVLNGEMEDKIRAVVREELGHTPEDGAP